MTLACVFAVQLLKGWLTVKLPKSVPPLVTSLRFRCPRISLSHARL
jgi:hypothetical protein